MPVITFSEDGSVEFTRKPEMLALFEGERKQIDRMTDILHHPETDRYYFKFLTGPFAGEAFTSYVYDRVNKYGEATDTGWSLARILDNSDVPAELVLLDPKNDIYSTWTTSTYEDCAKLEVWFVDWMRRIMGGSMAGPEVITIPSMDVLKANATEETLAYLKKNGGFGGSFARVRILDNTPPPLFEVMAEPPGKTPHDPCPLCVPGIGCESGE